MVAKVECTHLSFRRIVKSIGETFFDNAGVTMLSSYTKVICIDEAACVITSRLVIGVDVKGE